MDAARSYVPLDTKQVISETLETETETKTNLLASKPTDAKIFSVEINAETKFVTSRPRPRPRHDYSLEISLGALTTLLES